MKKFKFLALMLCGIITASAFIGCKTDEGGGKMDPEAINIVSIAKGYGYQYAEDLVDAYNATNPAVKANFAYQTPEESFVLTSLSSGPERNNVDVYFSLSNSMFNELSQPNYVTGYSGPAWADLSDVYNTVAVGYEESNGSKTYGQLMDPYFMNTLTHPDYFDSQFAGKQFAVPWASGFNGFLYNKTLWDAANANLSSAQQEQMELPKTTKEMFDLFDRIKNNSVIYNSSIAGSGTGKKYAFTYSGIDNYMDVAYYNWWSQYDGLEKANAFYQGKDLNGNYTAEIYNSQGRLHGFENISKMIKQSNGYVNSNDISTAFKTSQMNFLKGKAFFNLNGEWLENETSTEFNPGECDVRYFRAPVISEIVDNPKISNLFSGTAAQKDEQLRKALDYIDTVYIEGGTSDKNATVLASATAAQLDYLIEARLIQSCQIRYVAAVPDYTSKKEAAKNFLKFMLSKQGQEVIMAATYGSKTPLNVDVKQFDYYQQATNMCKTKLDILNNCKVFAQESQSPIFFKGGAAIFRGNGSNFAVAFGTSAPVSASTYFDAEKDYMQSIWVCIVEKSGLSN